jgi:hypothetical protein
MATIRPKQTRPKQTWNGLGTYGSESQGTGGAPPDRGQPQAGGGSESGGSQPGVAWSGTGELPPPPSLPKLSRPPGQEGGSVAEAPPGPDPTAGLPAAGFGPEEALNEQIQGLEAWARVIVGRSRTEAARYWTLRGLALCTAAVAVALALRGLELAAVVLVALSALSLVIEMAWPGSSQSAAYRRAAYELRELQSAVQLRWQKVRLSHPDPTSRKRVAYAVELLELIHSKREEVGGYLGTSEPNEGIKRPG